MREGKITSYLMEFLQVLIGDGNIHLKFRSYL